MSIGENATQRSGHVPVVADESWSAVAESCEVTAKFGVVLPRDVQQDVQPRQPGGNRPRIGTGVVDGVAEQQHPCVPWRHPGQLPRRGVRREGSASQALGRYAQQQAEHRKRSHLLAQAHQHRGVGQKATTAKESGAGSRTAPGRSGGSMTDEQKADRRQLIEINKAMKAATETRREFIRSLLARRTTPKGVLPYAADVLTGGEHRWLLVRGYNGMPNQADAAVREALGIDSGPFVDTRLPLAILAQVPGDTSDGGQPKRSPPRTSEVPTRTARWSCLHPQEPARVAAPARPPRTAVGRRRDRAPPPSPTRPCRPTSGSRSATDPPQWKGGKAPQVDLVARISVRKSVCGSD